MAKIGNRRTGQKSLPPRAEVEEYENPKLPPPPLNVVKAPRVPKLALATHSLLSVTFRHIKPSWRGYILYVDMAARKGDEAMRRFREAYESLPPKERAGAWPEQICDMANVEPGELYGAVCRQLWDSKAAESSMMCSIEHPEVLGATIKFAKRPGFYHDRELFLRSTGSLPDRKGASINIYNQAAAGAAAALPEAAQAKLRTFDDEIIDMSRDLEAPDAPFLVKQDVPSDDHPAND